MATPNSSISRLLAHAVGAPPATAEHTFTAAAAALPPREFVRQVLAPSGARYPTPPAPSAENLRVADAILRNHFCMVGEGYTLPADFSWQYNPSRDKEWQIAQHKFYFAIDLAQAYRQTLNPAYLHRWAALIERWLDTMGSGFIAASDAQVEAKRAEHWLRSLMLLRGTPAHRLLGAPFLRRLLARIADEACYILQHLKPARNHRTFQLFTVFMVGVLLPQLRLQRHFIEQSVPALTANLLTDFLPDGVHVELTSHYHELVLETALAFVELAQLNAIPLDPALLPRLAHALEFSQFLQWPNGDIPLLSDSDNGDHRPLLALGSRLLHDERLLWAATLGQAGQPPQQRARHFDYAGYLVLSNGWGHDHASFLARQHIVYDCARLGEGSHSHYDLFSFCYYLNGAPAVIDPGRYTYCAEPDAEGVDWRRQFKSTAYHNTVTIDGRDQTRYISKAGRPRRDPSHPNPSRRKHGPPVQIHDKLVSLGSQTDYVTAVAQSAEYSPLHRRTLVFVQQQYLFLLDQIAIDDQQDHECALRFHLAEQWRGQVALVAGEHDLAAQTTHFQIRACAPEGTQARIDEGWVSTQYGVKAPAPVLTLVQQSAQPVVFGSLVAPSGGALAIHALQQIAAPAHTLLFRVVGSYAGQPFVDWMLAQDSQADACVVAGLVFHGRFLTWRQDSAGQIVALRAIEPTQLAGPGLPHFDITPERPIEWSAHTPH